MVDIHSHILPKIDDGSQGLSMTYEMLRRCSDDGVKKIIATPHYYDCSSAEFRKVKAMVRMLNKLLYKQNLDMKIFYGQEVYLTENILKEYEKKKIGTINDSRYMLIELNMDRFSHNMLNMIYELRIRDIVPIIAHPERYNFILKKSNILNSLIKEGCLFQINSGSIEGNFGWKVKKRARILMRHNIYSFIGSDAHNNSKRKTGIKKSLKFLKKVNVDCEDYFESNSEKLLNNQIIEFKGEKINRKMYFYL